MVKDALAMAMVTVILTIGTASAFWDVVLFGQQISGPQTVTPKRAVKERAAAKVTGSVTAIDKKERTVTLVAPPGDTLTLTVRDPQRLDAVRIGDPVVATYYEALVIRVQPARAAPSDTPALVTGNPLERQVTLTAAIADLDERNGTLTLKGLGGDVETVKVRDPQILMGIKVGDLVHVTVTPALVVSLEKSYKR